MFLRLFRCSAVITMASLQWLLLVSEEQGELMAREMDFRKPRLREYTAASSLWFFFCQYPPEVSHCSCNRESVSPGNELNFITNDVFVIKIRWKIQLVRFSYDKKSANEVTWKDKEYRYISSA